MRKPRNFDAAIDALADKARQLRQRKVMQLGELVIATGADAIEPEELAGVLLTAARTKDREMKEGWRETGAAFFQRSAKTPAIKADREPGSLAKGDSGDEPGPGPASAP